MTKFSLKFDPRVTPVRDDLAAAHLRSTIKRKTYVEASRQTVCVPFVSVRKQPSISCGIETQLIYGTAFDVYNIKGNWAWGQEVVKGGKGYVGYVAVAALGEDIMAPSHRISVLRAPIFLAADLKTPVQLSIPLNAKIHVTAKDGDYAHIDGLGYVHTRHIMPIAQNGGDYVCVAESHLGLPYIWGGVSSDGLDCSGLLQSSLRATGQDAPRDTDMQEAVLGTRLRHDAKLQRGDLVFWKGHVGVLRDAQTLLHANAYHMEVTSELLCEAINRIAKSAGAVTSLRRF